MLTQDCGGYNKTGLVLASLALYEFHTRPSYSAHEQTTETAAPGVRLAIADVGRHWFSSAVSLGSLLFSLHCLLSDSGTLIAWSWTGYEDRRPRGPQPNLHGSITLVAQCLGLLISVLAISRQSNILTHPLWFIYGAASSAVMYRYRNWPGYIGGLHLAIFMMSIIPQVLQDAASTSKGRIAKTYFTAWLVACLLDLANVWTVAYAFVPGGVYLRERSDM